MTNFSNYKTLPDDWVLAVGDVVASTKAIESGRYKAVNMAGASVIVALLNALGHRDYPFVFGGDGALVALPGDAETTATKTLSELRTWVAEDLDLDLRAAIVPYGAIKLAGLEVRVGRYMASRNVAYAMFAGGGATWAEAEMKAGRYCIDRAPWGSKPDLSGLSCRWDPISATHGKIVSLLVIPDDERADDEFRDLISAVIELVSAETREAHPLPAAGPPIHFTTKGVAYEAKAVAGKNRLLATEIFTVFQTVLAILLDRFGLSIGQFDARAYKAEVAENSDFRKFDDGLKMTVDIPPERVKVIENILEEASRRHVCKYGIHQQDAALMTCFVSNFAARDHMHFIDGAGGGYAMAAQKLKERFSPCQISS